MEVVPGFWSMVVSVRGGLGTEGIDSGVHVYKHDRVPVLPSSMGIVVIMEPSIIGKKLVVVEASAE